MHTDPPFPMSPADPGSGVPAAAIDPALAYPATTATVRSAAAVDAEVDDVLAWYAGAARDLPWRRDTRPWPVLVSEVMAQQTPVARVVPAWEAWLARWPTPADLAAASPADVLAAWDRLGYPRRALRLRECAAALVERHGGEVPADEEALRALPGIGAYTAAAVMAFAFGRRAVVLDINIRRLLARWLGGLALQPPNASGREWRLADRVTPAGDERGSRWPAAAMELGALVCRARSPLCPQCPLAAGCAWLSAGRPADAEASRRRIQGYEGTDRQQRGRAMSVLRDAHRAAEATGRGEGWVALAVLAAALDPERADRIIEGLAADGLLEFDAARLHGRLPGPTAPGP